MSHRVVLFLLFTPLMIGSAMAQRLGRPGMPAPIAEPPRPPGMPAPTVEPQPTRIRIDVYQVETRQDRLASFALDKLAQRRPDPQEMLSRLKEFGTPRLIQRFDSRLDLKQPTSLTHSRRVPVVQDIRMTNEGKTTPSVTYNEVGQIVKIQGNWRKEGHSATADVALDFNMSSVDKSGVEVAGGIKLPSFSTLSIKQQLVLTSGRPALVMNNNPPEPDTEDSPTTVTLLSITAERLEDGAAAQTRPAGEAAADTGPPVVIHAEIVEWTGQPGKLDPEEIERQLAESATLEQGMEVLKQLGEAQVISRPTILVNWPQEAEIAVGQRVPVVTDVDISTAGEAKPVWSHGEFGLRIKLKGHWLEDVEPGRAKVSLNLQHRQLIECSMLGSRPDISLPHIAERTWNRIGTVEAHKSVWLAFQPMLSMAPDKSSLILARLTVHPRD